MTWAQRMAEIRTRWAARPETWEPVWYVRVHGEPNRHVEAETVGRARYAQGEPAWGWVLVGWNDVFSEGVEDGPATLVSSEDPAIQAAPELLRIAHDRYWALRTHGSKAPGLRRLVPWVRREVPPEQPGRFPALLSGPWQLWEAGIRVDRSHLPGGSLRHSIVPILRFTDPGRRGVMILPRWHWARDHVAEWTAAR